MSIIIPRAENVLSASVLARYVLPMRPDENPHRVLTVIKEKELSPIYYWLGTPMLREKAKVLKLRDAEIGFGGSVQGVADDIMNLTKRGTSLSPEYLWEEQEAEETFRAISSMLVNTGFTLKWD